MPRRRTVGAGPRARGRPPGRREPAPGRDTKLSSPRVPCLFEHMRSLRAARPAAPPCWLRVRSGRLPRPRPPTRARTKAKPSQARRQTNQQDQADTAKKGGQKSDRRDAVDRARPGPKRASAAAPAVARVPGAAPSPRRAPATAGPRRARPPRSPSGRPIRCPPECGRRRPRLRRPLGGAPRRCLLRVTLLLTIHAARTRAALFEQGRARATSRRGALAHLLSLPTPWAGELPPPPYTPRAVAAAGAVPSGYTNGLQAAEACRVAGKRLCTEGEWRTACRGDAQKQFPYGSLYRQDACNVFREAHPSQLLHGNASLYHDDPRLNARATLLPPAASPPATIGVLERWATTHWTWSAPRRWRRPGGHFRRLLLARHAGDAILPGGPHRLLTRSGTLLQDRIIPRGAKRTMARHRVVESRRPLLDPIIQGSGPGARLSSI